MILGIIISIFAVVAWFVLRLNYEEYQWVYLPILFVIGMLAMFLFMSPLWGWQQPNNNPYFVDTVGGIVAFRDYSKIGNDIEIPAHYYIDYSWINSWKYYDSPIKVISPEGQTIIGTFNHGSGVKPYIVGECK